MIGSIIYASTCICVYQAVFPYHNYGVLVQIIS
jgi:hypothetical protein